MIPTTTSLRPPSIRGAAQRQLADDGYAVVEVPLPMLDQLDELYRATRPPELREFTASIQIELPGHKRAVHEGVRAVVEPFVASCFLDHRVVAGNFVVKQPGPWVVQPHQDFDFTDEARWAAVLAWIPLHSVGPSDGALGVVPGSHRLETLPRGSGDHRFPFGAVGDHLMAHRSVVPPLERGQALLYDARTLHWSGSNDGTRERVAAAFAAIPRQAPLLHQHVRPDDTVETLAVDDDVYADTPFHGYPVRGEVISVRPLGQVAAYDDASVDRALAAVSS